MTWDVPYLTAPKGRPCTGGFWLNQPNTTMGAMASTEAADSLDQNRPSGLEYDAISAASVPALAAVRLSDQNASFHASTRHSRPVDAMPPMASGRMTWRNSVSSEAPSMRAASRISGGMSLKCEYSIHTISGRLPSMNTTISANVVSSTCSVCAITYTGTSAPTGGIILVDSIHIRMSLVRLLGKNAIEYAAGAAMTSPTMVDTMLVISE